MLECRACLWRCLRAICPEISPNPLIKLTRPFPRSRPHRTVRLSPRYASSLSIRGGENAVKPENSIIKAVKSRPAGAVKLPEGLTSAQFRRLKLEVPWLGGDRVKVLRRTKELLKEQRQAEALELVKLSSKEQPCTIAWNAILDDLLERKKVNEAFKVYNDV